jgi:hypothetical protein
LGFGNTTGSVWNGMTATGLGAFTMHECDISAQNICLNVTSPGDTEVANNRFTPVSANAIGVKIQGDPGGIRMLSNKFNSGIAYHACISIIVAANTADGDIFIIGNSMEGVFAGGYGIIIDQAGGASFANVLIIGNEISTPGSGSWAIYFTNTTLGWLNQVIIASNVLQSPQGIFLGAMTNFVFQGNTLVGTGATLVIGANCVSGAVIGNIMTAISNSSASTTVANNQGLPASSPTLLTVLGQPNAQIYNAVNLNFAGFTSTYDNYMLVFENVVPSGNGVSAELQQIDMPVGGGSQVTETSGYLNAAGGATSYIDLLAGGTIGNTTSGGGFGISGVVYVHDVNGQGGIVKYWEGQVAKGANTPAITVNTVAAFCNLNKIIVGFQFQFSSGNVASGQIKVYGLP